MNSKYDGIVGGGIPIATGAALASQYREEWEDKKRENIVIKPVEREETTYGLNEFIECLRKGKEPSTNFEDNIKSFAMVCAAAESSRLGEVVRVELGQNIR